MLESSKGGYQSNANFENNWRRKQELKLRPVADKIYQEVFEATNIKRCEPEDDHTLDKEFAIDVTLTLQNMMVLTGQEKFLSHNYASFHSVTVEYMNNPQDKGDWFKLACQFYMTGYANETNTAFEPWVILNWPQVVICTNAGLITWIDNANKDGHARASFRYTNMFTIPSSCIVASSWTNYS